MPSQETMGAIILCGGRSIRMGRDKALLPFGQESFLEHICRIVTPSLTPVIVAVAEDQKVPELGTDVRVVTDILPDAGPLVGLLSGLEEFHRCHPSRAWVWLTACDAPFVSLPVIRRLQADAGLSEAVVISREGRHQPFGGLYRSDILPQVRQLIDEGERSLQRLLGQLDCTVIDAESLRELDPDLAFLRNINTPDDYQRFLEDSQHDPTDD